MSHQRKLRLMIGLCLALLFSVALSSSASLAADTRNAAIILLPLDNVNSTPLSWGFGLLRPDGTVSVIKNLPKNIHTFPVLGRDHAVFVLLDQSNHLLVMDLMSGHTRSYPAPAELYPSPNPYSLETYMPLDALFTLDGKRLILMPRKQDFYLLTLANGTLRRIPNTRLYQAIAQSPADGLIYANHLDSDEEIDGGIARFDLWGNRQVITPTLGNYYRPTYTGVTLSPAGKYLYFLALDPRQSIKQPQYSAESSNVIMRDRISDGKVAVVARAAPGNEIVSFTLTSNDPYITYDEIANSDKYDPYSTHEEIPISARYTDYLKRLNLATKSPPQQLAHTTYGFNPLWCGDTLYYDEWHHMGRYITYSRSPLTGKTTQAEGSLVGCAP